MEINIRNIRLNYKDYNKDQDLDPVVLLHGWGANIDTMEPIARVLEGKFRTILLDMPGFGKSQEPDQVYDSFDYVGLVLEFLQALGIEKASFIGHSFGGKVAAIIASQKPQVVDKLVLIDAAGIKPKRNLSYYLRVYSYKLGRKLLTSLPIPNKEERIQAYKDRHGSDDYKNAQGIMRQIMVTVVNEDIRPLLSKIEADTLLVWGDQDQATPLYMGKTYEKEIKSSGLVVLEGAGHYAYLDDYPTFSRVLKSYMEGASQ